MIGYLLKRLAGACVVLWVIITITFGLMHAIPGGPFTQEKQLPPAVMATVEARYHLNDPLWDQYLEYVKHAAVLDLGPSYKYPGKTVNDIIAETFPVSAELGLISLCLAIGIGIPAGMAAAWYKNTRADYVLMIGATLGVSVPSFIIAALLIQLFAFTWPVLPAAMWKGPAYAVLPALALAAHPTAFIMRLTRSGILDALAQDYIRTARSRGVGEWSLLCRHALRNALLPVVSYIGPLAAALLTGSFVVETIFAIPGLGRHFVTSIYNRDYTVILGITIFYSFLIMMMNLLIDVIYPFLDPRIALKQDTKEE
ncbi:peptide ABC transporter permease [Megasphaera cerevisiae DSM 20462]|uniref:Peptide ABC transporter permease n=1 Tax=Megasphaera cerevisiae DSM 20462 TaxID=1122219 RepID=A0A0J6WWC4_9FIRM|nr:ABC transporter permease [Megasphaera cerevisiae]KMO86107.1 peptide ABC transporter permease [Megasphaera cerevisiae DSM 20462]SKA19877.1 oligopeptide transport system permease protein [Megasphaera cerevisiae DSM 20462]